MKHHLEEGDQDFNHYRQGRNLPDQIQSISRIFDCL